MTTPSISITPAPAPAPTWEQVKTNPGLQGFSIRIHAFGEITGKPWVKGSTEIDHWGRIISIAETSAEEISGAGFSWVSMVAVDGQIFTLAPPAHLADLIKAG